MSVTASDESDMDKGGIDDICCDPLCYLSICAFVKRFLQNYYPELLVKINFNAEKSVGEFRVSLGETVLFDRLLCLRSARNLDRFETACTEFVALYIRNGKNQHQGMS